MRDAATGGTRLRAGAMGCLAVCLALTAASCDEGSFLGWRSAPSRLPEGSLPPDFQLVDLHGAPRTLPDYRGKVVLLNFWATWCGPCLFEMPSMEILYRDIKHEGFEILAVALERKGRAATQPFVESKGLTFPILHDTDFRVGKSYGVRSVPMSFLIDRRGMMTHRIFGARDWNSHNARALIHTILRES